jgi:hypothetical protein
MINACTIEKYIIEFTDGEENLFARILKKIKERPAGFIRGSLTDEEQAVLNRLCELFDFTEMKEN